MRCCRLPVAAPGSWHGKQGLQLLGSRKEHHLGILPVQMSHSGEAYSWEQARSTCDGGVYHV